MKSLRLRFPFWALVTATLSAFGCSGDKAPARGQIMLALQTDMSLPADVSRVKLQVLTDKGEVKYDRTFSVGANGEAKIPATFAIVAPEGQSPTVEVRVIGISGTNARTFAKTITTVPKDRIAILRMPIQWLCDGKAQTVDAASETYETTCPIKSGPNGDIDTACVAGTCQDVHIEEAKLPTFAPPDVFGGGKDADDASGSCFDTVACFDQGFALTPDAACRVAVVAKPTATLNFALRPSQANEGICGSKGCYVPLDESEIFGWSELPPGTEFGGGNLLGEAGAGGAGSFGAAGAGGADGSAGDTGVPNLGGTGAALRVAQLPPAVCEKLKSGVIASVHATAVCDTKTERTPICGDWYSTKVTKVVPRMDGTTTPGGGSCPEFKPGGSVGTLSTDRLLNGMYQAVADFKAHSATEAAATLAACVAIVEDLGGTAPQASTPPTDNDITAACQAASDAVTAASGDAPSWSMLVAAGDCGLSIDGQATCESTCSQTACSAKLPSADTRCSDIGGTCLSASGKTTPGACTGTCSPIASTPVTCQGSCEGVCTGTCAGDCIAEDGSTTADSCNGWCTGTCSGTCGGACTVQSAPCDGECWTSGGDCIGTLTDLFCRQPLDAADCLGDCGRLCAAREELDVTCEASSASVYGNVPSALRATLNKHFAELLDIMQRSGADSEAAALLEAIYSTYAAQAATSDAHALACINTAGTALGSGIVSIATASQAASTLVSTVATVANNPGTVTCTGIKVACGATCVDITTDPANCGQCGKACANGYTCSLAQCTLSGDGAGGAGAGGAGAGAKGGTGAGASAGTSTTAGGASAGGGATASGGRSAGGAAGAAGMTAAGTGGLAVGGTSGGGGGAAGIGGLSGASGGGGVGSGTCPTAQPAGNSDCTMDVGVGTTCQYAPYQCTCSVDGGVWLCSIP